MKSCHHTWHFPFCIHCVYDTNSHYFHLVVHVSAVKYNNNVDECNESLEFQPKHVISIVLNHSRIIRNELINIKSHRVIAMEISPCAQKKRSLPIGQYLFVDKLQMTRSTYKWQYNVNGENDWTDAITEQIKKNWKANEEIVCNKFAVTTTASGDSRPNKETNKNSMWQLGPIQ